MEYAFHVWLMNASSTFSTEEKEFFERYTAEKFPNLQLIRAGDPDEVDK